MNMSFCLPARASFLPSRGFLFSSNTVSTLRGSYGRCKSPSSIRVRSLSWAFWLRRLAEKFPSEISNGNFSAQGRATVKSMAFYIILCSLHLVSVLGLFFCLAGCMALPGVGFLGHVLLHRIAEDGHGMLYRIQVGHRAWKPPFFNVYIVVSLNNISNSNTIPRKPSERP